MQQYQESRLASSASCHHQHTRHTQHHRAGADEFGECIIALRGDERQAVRVGSVGGQGSETASTAAERACSGLGSVPPGSVRLQVASRQFHRETSVRPFEETSARAGVSALGSIEDSAEVIIARPGRLTCNSSTPSRDAATRRRDQLRQPVRHAGGGCTTGRRVRGLRFWSIRATMPGGVATSTQAWLNGRPVTPPTALARFMSNCRR